MGKPIVVIMEAGQEYAGLVLGLGSVAVVEEIVYKPEADLPAMLTVATRRVLDRAAAVAS